MKDDSSGRQDETNPDQEGEEAKDNKRKKEKKQTTERGTSPDPPSKEKRAQS